MYLSGCGLDVLNLLYILMDFIYLMFERKESGVVFFILVFLK